MRVEDHIDWAKTIALKYRRERNIPIEYEEAISLGMLGLMEAVGSYREGKGAEFRTFAWRRVRGRLRDWVRLSMNPKHHARVISLEDLSPWKLPSTNGTERKIANEELVWKILKSVKFPEAYAMKRYYLDGLTMQEVGREMVVTEARVSQILADGRERARRKWAS